MPGWSTGLRVQAIIGFKFILVTNQILQSSPFLFGPTDHNFNLTSLQKPKGKNKATSTFSKCLGNLAGRTMSRINGENE